MRYFLGICLIIFFGCVHQKLENKKVSSGTIQLFQNNMVHFSLVDSINAQYETIRVSSQDNGREIMTQAELPMWDDNIKITAKVTLRPIPKDLLSVFDPWDRAGHVRLLRVDGPDVELMKFMTAYGGETEWEEDVSHLALLLRGTCQFVGWIDTWVSPGWRMDFSLDYESGGAKKPDWIEPVFYELSYELTAPGNEGMLEAQPSRVDS